MFSRGLFISSRVSSNPIDSLTDKPNDLLNKAYEKFPTEILASATHPLNSDLSSRNLQASTRSKYRLNLSFTELC